MATRTKLSLEKNMIASFYGLRAKETIQESPAQDLTYSELRSRLPNSISDQVVQLLANSKQALLDFAEIRTQQDVDQFNQQYDVTLTLPQEG